MRVFSRSGGNSAKASAESGLMKEESKANTRSCRLRQAKGIKSSARLLWWSSSDGALKIGIDGADGWLAAINLSVSFWTIPESSPKLFSQLPPWLDYRARRPEKPRF